MTPYKTQPGTIPHKAVQFLKTQGEGCEFTTAQLCEAIGCDTENFAYMMRRAIQAGLIAPRTKPGRGKLLFWRLGDGKPLPKAEDHEEDAPLPRKPEPKVAPRFPSVFPPKAAQEFRAALWTDGSLILCGVAVRADGSVVLPADQMAQVKNLIAWSAPV